MISEKLAVDTIIKSLNARNFKEESPIEKRPPPESGIWRYSKNVALPGVFRAVLYVTLQSFTRMDEKLGNPFSMLRATIEVRNVIPVQLHGASLGRSIYQHEKEIISNAFEATDESLMPNRGISFTIYLKALENHIILYGTTLIEKTIALQHLDSLPDVSKILDRLDEAE